MRMICGLVLMDRNAPQELCVDAHLAHDQSLELISEWHQKGRQQYAITPRFAITSSPEQLELAAKLAEANPDMLIHSHLSENLEELSLVSKLFPNNKDYLNVYEHYGLVSERSLFAHGVHLSQSECRRMAKAGSRVVFCPSSNNFLGSGLTDISRFEDLGVPWGIGSDVGAGTHLCMLEVMAEAYKVCQLKGHALNPLRAFYQATLGNAERLHLEDQVGSFKHGTEADFLVIDMNSTELMAKRMETCDNLAERLFVLMTLGDDRAVEHTYIEGKLTKPQ